MPQLLCFEEDAGYPLWCQTKLMLIQRDRCDPFYFHAEIVFMLRTKSSNKSSKAAVNVHADIVLFSQLSNLTDRVDDPVWIVGVGAHQQNCVGIYQ